MPKMVVKDGIQYRPEDAERLGIKDADDTIDVEQTGAPVLRAGETTTPDAENKARTISSGTAQRSRRPASGDTSA